MIRELINMLGMDVTNRAQVYSAPPAQFTKTASDPAAFPANYKERPVTYFDKELLRPGVVFDKNGKRHEVPEVRLDRAIATFGQARGKGFVPTLPENHDGTGKNYGYVADLKRDGKGSLTATVGFFNDTMEEALKKDASLSLLPKAIGDDGTEYIDLLDHVAINSLTQIANLDNFKPALAATRISGVDQFTSEEPEMKISEKALQCARRLSGKPELSESDAVDVLADLAEKGQSRILELTRALPAAAAPPSPREFFYAAKSVQSAKNDAVRAGLTVDTANRLAHSIVGTQIDYGKIQMSRAVEPTDSIQLDRMAILLDAFTALSAQGAKGFTVTSGGNPLALDRTVPNDTPETAAADTRKVLDYPAFQSAMGRAGYASDHKAYSEYCTAKGA